MVVVDSSGWIQFFTNGPLAEKYAEKLLKPAVILTPTLVLYEVYKKLKSQLGEDNALAAMTRMEETQIVSLSSSLAYFAADLSLEYKLAMADAIVYATALLHEATLITSDADFKNLPSVQYLPFLI